MGDIYIRAAVLMLLRFIWMVCITGRQIPVTELEQMQLITGASKLNMVIDGVPFHLQAKDLLPNWWLEYETSQDWMHLVITLNVNVSDPFTKTIDNSPEVITIMFTVYLVSLIF